MLTQLKQSLLALALISLAGCASQAPRVTNASLGFAITNYTVAADADEVELSNALESALSKVGIATAMPAKADVTIDFVRYESPIIGLFYGGQHYSSLSVVLSDDAGMKLESFPIYVAANGNRESADADLASAAAQIIAAKAANAFMPIKAQPKAVAKPSMEPAPMPVVSEPEIEIVAPPADDATPCVIGADGKCVVL